MKPLTTRRIVRISYFTMLTILGGLIRIPIPGTPIAITLQTLFVILSGLVLGPYDGAFAQIAYTVLGLIGLPVFTTGGGIDYVLRPSFGYILSFPIAAFAVGAILRSQKKRNSLVIFLCGLAGVLINYGIGIPYQVMALVLWSGSTFAAAIATVPSVLIMLVKDIALLVLLCLIYPRLMSMMKITERKQEDKEKTTAEPAPAPQESACATSKESNDVGRCPKSVTAVKLGRMKRVSSFKQKQSRAE